ncbi:YjgN family protein [Piscinibacter sp.]|jgi:uncharacterized membrane protein YjgN (DUF898 family)|uniref:YjgN family protein n=1 Tax=Piscinibacter sp. TaxID=1903157 RepID=UPI002F41EFA2
MNDTHDAGRIEPALHSGSAAEPSEHQLGVRFTGSGSEYFRIWIVNLLLTLVTLSLYYPWAKVRRLRYFHTNTLVGGKPLDFHGDPWRMLRGYLLVGLMVVLYSVAGHFSPVAGLVAFLIVAAIWPALLKASMQFRLANTSWRGLRFRFKGSIPDAYRAMLPLFVPGLMFVAALLAVPDQAKPPQWYGGFVLGVSFLSLLVLPWLWWNLKKYQHDHYALGPLQTELRASRGAFYGVFLKTFGVSLVVLVVAIVGVAVLGVAGFAGLFAPSGGEDRTQIVAVVMAVLLGVVIGLLGVQLIPRPYFTSRMQNLLWSRTGNRSMRFRSELRFLPLLGLTLKNWVLMLLTLGLYWPFAAVATARMRCEAVSVRTRVDPESLVDQVRAGDNDAAGDAAGDLFGLDIGL